MEHPTSKRRRSAAKGLGAMGSVLVLALACGRTGRHGSDASASQGGTDGNGNAGAGNDAMCHAPFAECSGTCRDLAADRANCGECGVTCEPGLVCDAGSCRLSCQSSLTECAGSCVDLVRDPEHCGACDNACVDGEVCRSSACELSCPGSLASCDGKCRDLQGDWANCGACGEACQPGEVCSAGKCSFNCGMTRSNCGGNCFDLATDSMNCGQCGDVCVGHCLDGRCQPFLVVNVTKDGNGPSYAPSVSGDGRFVGFDTSATNLSAMRAGGVVYDHDDGSFRRGTFTVDHPALVAGLTQLSTDAKFVLFQAEEDLADDDTNGVSDVYRVELATGNAQVASIPGPQGAYGISSFAGSEDANVVVFQGSDGRLYVRNMSDESSQVVAMEADVGGWRPAISGDGTTVAFDSSSLKLTNGTGVLQVFVEDLASSDVQLASSNSSGTPANEQSFFAALSRDGKVVAFQSGGSNLVADDTNNTYDIFVKDLETGTTTRASISSDGAEGNAASYQPALSADGRYVAFLSSASNLAPGDTNALIDVYVFDRVTRKTKRVSVDEQGTTGAGSSCQVDYFRCNRPALSSNGDIVVFESNAGNLVPGSAYGRMDVYWVNWKLLPEP